MDGKNDGFSTEIAKHASLSSSGYNSVVSEILERAKEKYPAAKLRIFSDNGPQCIACDFTEFIRL